MVTPQENKTITIYDIAREAGVSPSTVSRVLTNSANVRSEKKEKVQQLIKKYNFKPNALAKGLSDTKSKLIGVIIADVRNPYYAAVFVACEVAAKRRGYMTLLCNSLGDMQQELEQMEILRQQRVDAIIHLGGRADDLETNKKYVKKVKERLNVPLVITGKLDGLDCYKVQIDAKKAAELLMEHLIEQGHRKIALIGGRLDVISTYEKYQTYMSMVEKYQLDFKEEYIITGHYNNETGYIGMQQLIEQNTLPTAVVAINDYTAAGVMRCLAEHGYRIPQDVAVVSYDNTDIAKLLMPTLTSIDYNYDLLGERLVDTAIGAIGQEEVPELQMITPHLVVRESSVWTVQ